MKKIPKIIVSIILILTTIVFLVFSSVNENKAAEIAFKIATTVTITFSVTFSLTINVNQIKDSFNSVTYANKDNELDKCWKNCYRINGVLELIAAKIEQKNSFGTNKESDITNLVKKVFDLSDDCKELLSIYNGNKEITLFQKERIDFIREYLESLNAINDCLPISFVNTKENNERIDKLFLTAKTLNNKYSLYND